MFRLEQIRKILTPNTTPLLTNQELPIQTTTKTIITTTIIRLHQEERTLPQTRTQIIPITELGQERTLEVVALKVLVAQVVLVEGVQKVVVLDVKN